MSTGSRWNPTARTERVLRLHAEIREQRDAIAVLRAEWTKLDAPLRLQGLAERHLALKPLNATQYDQLKNLPERPPNFTRPGDPDPIGAMIDAIDLAAMMGSAPGAGGSAMTGQAQPKAKSAEPWRQRLVRSLLYGRECRSRRQGARARRICHPRIRSDLCGDRRPADDVRCHRRQSRRAPHRLGGRHRDRAAGYCRSQRRGARHRRQGAQPVRRTAPDHRPG